MRLARISEPDGRQDLYNKQALNSTSPLTFLYRFGARTLRPVLNAGEPGRMILSLTTSRTCVLHFRSGKGGSHHSCDLASKSRKGERNLGPAGPAVSDWQ
jgi:hypothetical protein